MDTPTIDMAKVEAFTMRAIGDVTAGYTGVMVRLGHKRGLYKAVAGGYLGYHAVSDSCELAPEHALALADEDSAVFIPHTWNVPAAMGFDEPKALDGVVACCAHAIAEGGKLVLRAQAGPEWLADVFRKAGFTHFRTAARTPFNPVFEIRR